MPLGSKLYRKNPVSAQYEEVPQVISMGFPGSTQEYDDITNLGSPAGYRERVATVKAPRDMPVEILWNPAVAMHKTLITDSATNPVPLREWKVLFPNASDGFTFSAYPGSPDGTLTPLAAARVTFTLGVSGEIVSIP